MIRFNEIKESAGKAFDQDDFFEFLTGRSGYDLPVQDAPVSVPTDWTRVIPFGIYALYEEKKDPEIVERYQKAIRRAIDGSCEDLWCAINVIYFQMDHEMMKKSPFEIDKKTIEGLKGKILSSKAALSERYPYGKNGWSMYEDILRLNHNFLSDWGFSFLN